MLKVFRKRSKRRKRPAEFVEVEGPWDEAAKRHEVQGWDTGSCLEFVTRSTSKTEERWAGGQVHEPVTAALHAAASMLSNGENSVLDYGGGLGVYRHIVSRALPGVVLDYHVAEVPVVAEHGSKHVPGVTFWGDDGFDDRRFSMVMALGSAHTSPDWRAMLRRLAGVTDRVLHIQLPLADKERLLLGSGWETKFLAWALPREELVAEVERTGFKLSWWCTVGAVAVGEGTLARGAFTFVR